MPLALNTSNINVFSQHHVNNVDNIGIEQYYFSVLFVKSHGQRKWQYIHFHDDVYIIYKWLENDIGCLGWTTYYIIRQVSTE